MVYLHRSRAWAAPAVVFWPHHPRLTAIATEGFRAVSTPLVRVLIVLGALVAVMAVATAIVFSRDDATGDQAALATPLVTITALPADLSGATTAPTAAAATTTAQPAATATPGPSLPVRANVAANVRGGPGTTFPIVTTLTAGQELQATARNIDATWLRITGNGVNGWVSADIVEVTGDVRQLSFANTEGGTATPAATGTARP